MPFQKALTPSCANISRDTGGQYIAYPRTLQHTAQRSLARLLARLLDTRLDRVDRSVREGTQRTRDQTDRRSLVRRQLIDLLQALRKRLQLLVRREVGRLVGGLARGREGHTTVERAKALLANDGVESVTGVAVARDLVGVRERVLLRLQPDLDDLHGVHDEDRLRRTGTETSCTC